MSNLNDDYLVGLNDRQREAATWGEPTEHGWEAHPLLIIAGAGTGKTNTLAHRVAHLLLNGVDPERILLLTFSRRASVEMRSRVERIVRRAMQGSGPGDRRRGSVRIDWSGTFHSIGNRILRRYHANIGLDENFSILDRGDAADLLDVARHKLGLHEQKKRFPRKDTCLAIYSRTVNTRAPLESILDKYYSWCREWSDELRSLFREFVSLKQRDRALDYDDLLLYWYHLMQDQELAADVSRRFDHILVDEYQDTNILQADILRSLRPDGQGLTVVGDDAQSIYSFRAATVDNILKFPELFEPPAHIVKLETNYRSDQPILDTANALIADSTVGYQKALSSDRPSSRRPKFVTVADEEAETRFIADQILDAREDGTPLREQAVLFRTAHHSDRLELELIRRDIPYVKYGGLKFLEAAHVKDLLAVLRWVDNPRNSVAGFRALQLMPGIGPARAQSALDAIAGAAYQWNGLADVQVPADARTGWTTFVDMVGQLSANRMDLPEQVRLARQWYEPQMDRLYRSVDARVGDLDQLEQIASQYPGREPFLSELALDPPAATGDESGDAILDEDYVILSTVHSAKGQEWDRVYVMHVSDGTFPSEFSTGDPDQLEEERRLLYVALTRARYDLKLIAPLKYYVPQQPRRGDRHVYGARSRFLTDRVLETMEKLAWPPGSDLGSSDDVSQKSIDVADQIKSMW